MCAADGSSELLADHRLAGAALRRYDLGSYRLVPLAASFNTVLRVDTAAGRYVLRIGPAQRIHAAGAAELEDRWTRDLDARGLRVPRVVPTRDGSVSVVVRDEHGAARECTVLTWRPGHTPVTDLPGLAALGAQLHDASPPLDARPRGALSLRSVLQFELPDRLAELPAGSRDVLLAARDRAQLAVDALWHGADTPPRLVHTDLTPTNAVRDEDGLAVIDVQDAAWGHVEQDLAHTIYGLTRGVDLDAGLRAVRAAYEQLRPWPALDLGLLTDLVAARRVAMVNLAVHRRRPGLGAYAAGHADALRAYVH